MASPFIVEWYQLNASIDRMGESAIAILVKQDGTGGGKGSIQSVVLVDGGQEETAKLVAQTLNEIAAAYALTSLKIDTIVMTHWDIDHGKGIVVFLCDKNNWVQVDDPATSTKTYQHKYLQYDDTNANLGKTVFCVQDWVNGGPALNWAKKTTKYGIVADSTMVKVKNSPFWVSIQVKGLSGTTATVKKTQQLWTLAWPNLMLGYNVFSGISATSALGAPTKIDLYPNIPITQWPNLGNPKKLLAGNNPWSGRNAKDWTNAPGLYIVAVDKNFLQPEDLEVIPTKPTEDDWKKDDANWGSIVMTLIWKTPASGEATVSLYTGGSKAGTSTDFIEGIKPEHILISAATKFNHPDPAIVLYLSAYLTNVGATGKRIHSVCFPYNMGYVEDPAYFQEARFFLSEVADGMSKDFTLPDTAPTTGPAVLWWNFLTHVKAFEPGPFQRITDALKGAAAYVTTGLPKKVKQVTDKIGALQQNIDDEIPDPALPELPWEDQLEFQKDVLKYLNSDDGQSLAKVKNDSIFKQVCDCWARWSDVDNTYYPLYESEELEDPDKKGEIIQMKYMKVTFEYGVGATFEAEPKSSSFGTINESKRLKYVPDGFSLTSRLVGGTKRKQPVEALTAPAPPAHNFVMSLSQELYLRRKEIEMNPLEVDPEDANADGTAVEEFNQSESQLIDDLGGRMNTDSAMTDSTLTSVAASALASIPLGLLGIPSGPLSTFPSIQPDGYVVDPNADPKDVPLILADCPANLFVNCLDDLSISVTTMADPKDSTRWQATATDVDGLENWLSSFFEVSSGDDALVTSIAVQLGGVLSPALIEQVTVVPTLQSAVTSGPKTVSTLSLVSTKINEGFNVSDSSAMADPYGFAVDSSGSLMLGLDVANPGTASFSITLADLFRLIDLDLPPLMLDGSTKMTILSTVDPASKLTPPTNGVWFCAGTNYTTTLRLTCTGPSRTALPGLTVDLTKLGMNFTETSIVASKRAYRTQATESNNDSPSDFISMTGNICYRATVSFGSSSNVADSQVWLNFSDTSLDLAFQWDEDNVPNVGDFLKWIASNAGFSDQGKWDSFATVTGNILPKLRQVTMSLNYDATGQGSFNFDTAFSLTLESDLDFGIDSPTARVPARLVFTYRSGGDTSSSVSFRGDIWPYVSPQMLEYDQLNANALFASRMVPNTADPQYYFSLAALTDDTMRGSLPSFIPTRITALSFEIDNESVGISGTMVDDPSSPSTPSTTPWLQLERIDLSLTYTFGKSVDFSFDAELWLQPRGNVLQKAILDVAISYDTGQWSIEASLSQVYMSCLYSLFPDSDNDAIMNVMQDIYINSIVLEYTKAGSDYTFEADGMLIIGDVFLDLSFSRTTTSWTFTADLTADFSANGDIEVSLGALLAGLASELEDILPDFITQAFFTVPQTDEDADPTTRPSVHLVCEALGQSMVLSIVANVGAFSFSYVQFSPTANAAANQKAQRLLRIEMDKIKGLQSSPILDQLTQPFDQMDFIWVGADPITVDDVAFLNQNVYQTAAEQLIYKASTKQGDTTAFAPGCHFLIITQESDTPTVVLDYNFAGGSPPPDTSILKSSAPKTGHINLEDDLPDPVATTGSTTWTKTVGPLTISSIGIKYDNTLLRITLDASLQLGPLSGSLKGFGIEFPIPSNIKNIDLSQVQVLLEGVGLEMDQPPIVIAGLLQRYQVGTDDGYFGGLSIEVEPYTFTAGGFFGKTLKPDPNPNKDSFKTVFVFADVEGPVIELEFASLNNLQGGVGYNNQMTMPTVQNVLQFPFLVASTQPDPLKVLSAFMTTPPSGVPWFAPDEGSIWIAAGLEAKASQALSISAVVCADFSKGDVVLGVFADATAQMPCSVTDDSELLARADLGIIAIVDFGKGTFRCEGQLSPNSFILDQNCHLTGGFALCYFFTGSGHEGDWVFTLGGYHSAFSPPEWYPVPPRLAITWQFDTHVSIYGDAYFAVTPKVCMGGGALAISFIAGDLSAQFKAWADFLINYRPFSFMADIGVSVDISYKLKLGCLSHTFHVHFGASLDLHGPPVAGIAHVDWSVCSFDVHFGRSTANQDPVGWLSFVNLLLQKGSSSSDPALTDESEITGNIMHTTTATNGLTQAPGTNNISTESNTVGTDTWLVNGNIFSFQFTSMFPPATVSYVSSATPSYDYKTDNPQYPGPSMQPMHIEDHMGVTSSLTVTVNAYDPVTQKDLTGANDPPAAAFGYQPIVKQVPAALWQAYDPTRDPLSSSKTQSSISTLLDPSAATIPAPMGYSFLTPPPTVSSDSINFNFTAASFVSPAGTAALPANFSVPADIDTLAWGAGAGKTSAFLSYVSSNTWLPVTPSPPYDPKDVLRPIQSPAYIATPGLLNSWVDYQNLSTGAVDAMARWQGLDDCVGGTPEWVKECFEDEGRTLPVLSQEATVESLLDGKDKGVAWMGARPVLQTEFVSGGVA